MNYELKSINPMSVLVNSARIFLVVGFLVAILTFFFFPGTSTRIEGVGQKLVATILFTFVYALVVSAVLTLVAWLYNFWAASFKGVKVHFEQE